MPKPREYCCCAIPLVNAGIYTALTEQFVLGLAAGIVSVATPHIVGATTFSAAKIIFAIVCWVGAALQILGFLAVSGEKPGLFRRYAQLHSLATVAAFAVAGIWIAISATGHKTAVNQCLTDFFPTDPNNSAASAEGKVLCDIFPWVDVGIMGGLWAILAIMQLYLIVVVRSYSSSQRMDHKQFDSEYDGQPLTRPDSFAMHKRSPTDEAWDSRPSMDTRALEGGAYGHVRSGSLAANEKYAPRTPDDAYTQDPGPTPYLNQEQNMYGGATSGTAYPAATQSHPAEGSFGRKTPRQRSTLEAQADPFYRQ